MDVEQYKQAVVAYLQSGEASDEAWKEVGEHLAAESECQPLRLDVEMGFAVICECGEVVWTFDADANCETCGRRCEATPT